MSLSRYLVKAYDVELREFTGLNKYNKVFNQYLENKHPGFRLDITESKTGLKFSWSFEIEDADNPEHGSIQRKLSLTKKSFLEKEVPGGEHLLPQIKLLNNKWKEELKVLLYVEQNDLYYNYIDDVYTENTVKFINRDFDEDLELDDWMRSLIEISDIDLIILPFFQRELDAKLGVTAEILRKKKAILTKMEENVLRGYYKGLDYETFSLIDSNTNFGHFILLWSGNRTDTGELGKALSLYKEIHQFNTKDLLELINRAERRFSFRTLEKGNIRRAYKGEVKACYDNFYLEPTFPEITKWHVNLALTALFMLTDSQIYFNKLSARLPDNNVSKHFMDLVLGLQQESFKNLFDLPSREEEFLQNLEDKEIYGVGNNLEFYLNEIYESRLFYSEKYPAVFSIYSDIDKRKLNRKLFNFDFTAKQLKFIREVIIKNKGLVVPDEALINPSNEFYSESYVNEHKALEEVGNNIFPEKNDRYSLEELQKITSTLDKVKAILYHVSKLQERRKYFEINVAKTVGKYNRCSDKQKVVIDYTFELLLDILVKRKQKLEESKSTISLESSLVNESLREDLFSQEENEEILLETTNIFG